jgi:ATP synthase F1 gamma subunit
MQNKKQLEKDINLIGSFKGLAQAYEEISVTKMQRARGKVLATRAFLDDLAQVFADVKSSYSDEISQLGEKKKGIFSFSTGNKNGKTIAVLISSNNKLYGDIGKKVFRFFMEDVRQNKADIYIIGKVGRELYDQVTYKKAYQYIDFPEGEESKKILEGVLKVMEQYQTVLVYYGQFVNVITQNPVKANVSGTKKLEEVEENKKHVKFFFEPSVESVLTVFENQIFGSLFRQTLHESELSHVTSRIQQMEYALQNIEISQKKLTKTKKLVMKRQESAKRLQRLSGASLWK